MKSPIRNLKQLGQALRNRRQAQKLSQKDLSHKTGLRQATLSDIEKGRHLSGDSLFRILNVLRSQIILQDIVATRDVYESEAEIHGQTKKAK